MDDGSRTNLARLLFSQHVAALGTLRDGAPMVTMVPYAPSADFSIFYIHISGLALHTQNIRQDPRVSLLIMQRESEQDPQTLARLSIMGAALKIEASQPEYNESRNHYLHKFPRATRNFSLGDFALYGIEAETARFVAGFGRIFDLTVEDLILAARSL
jgi:putative heme iron utilization protein